MGVEQANLSFSYRLSVVQSVDNGERHRRNDLDDVGVEHGKQMASVTKSNQRAACVHSFTLSLLYLNLTP